MANIKQLAAFKLPNTKGSAPAPVLELLEVNSWQIAAILYHLKFPCVQRFHQGSSWSSSSSQLIHLDLIFPALPWELGGRWRRSPAGVGAVLGVITLTIFCDTGTGCPSTSLPTLLTPDFAPRDKDHSICPPLPLRGTEQE
jgi:hypothetical protein